MQTDTSTQIVRTFTPASILSALHAAPGEQLVDVQMTVQNTGNLIVVTTIQPVSSTGTP